MTLKELEYVNNLKELVEKQNKLIKILNNELYCKESINRIDKKIDDLNRMRAMNQFFIQIPRKSLFI